MRGWILHDQREGLVKRLVSLLNNRCDKEDILSRLEITQWERKCKLVNKKEMEPQVEGRGRQCEHRGRNRQEMDDGKRKARKAEAQGKVGSLWDWASRSMMTQGQRVWKEGGR